MATLSAQDVKMLSSLGSDVGRSKYKYKRDNSWVFRRFGYSPRENPNKMIVVMHAYATGSDPVGQGFMKGYAPTLAEYIQILYSTVQTRGRLPKTLLVDFEAHVAALGEALRSAGVVGVLVQYYPPPSHRGFLIRRLFLIHREKT